MTPSPNYKDSKGESLKLTASGRKKDINPLSISQISNVNLYYEPHKFPETKIYKEHHSHK